MTDTLQRLQKVLAAAGVASRRKCEELITDGRVRVNGKVVTELGTKVRADRDRIEVDGKAVVGEAPVVFLLNKPRGVVSTASDPEGRETVVDLLKRERARLFPRGQARLRHLRRDPHDQRRRARQRPLSPALRRGRRPTSVKVHGHVPEATLEQWRKGRHPRRRRAHQNPHRRSSG